MIIDHNYKDYRKRWKASGGNKYNGAYYYSKEIVDNIIPNIKTDRNWITINTLGFGVDHSIVFIHNNKNPERYNWLSKYNDLILVCGVEDTCWKVAHLGTPIYIPLSVDVNYVKKFRRAKKTKEVAFAGRLMKMKYGTLPDNIDILSGLSRGRLLNEMSKYKKIYAVGRLAIEAKILGCEVLPYDKRYPDPEMWEIIDNFNASRRLQKALDKIDGKVNK